LTSIRTTSLAAAALATLGLLAGCAAGEAPPAANPSTSPPAAAAVAGDTNDDGNLSESEKQELAGNAPREILLSNGATASVTPGQPLPRAVIDQIAAEAAPGAAQIQTLDEFETVAGWRTIVGVASSYAEKLGRTVAILYRDGRGYWITTTSDDNAGTGLAATADKDAAIEAATGWAASNEAYLVVVD
jgi:hypothetical protein